LGTEGFFIVRERFMEQKQDTCPYCGGTELMKGKQFSQGCVFPYEKKTMWGTQHDLVHLICRGCGTVVRSYIEHPEQFH
jgi:DNA-directed RNA polymerase subunit RPC12/RpoP